MLSKDLALCYGSEILYFQMLTYPSSRHCDHNEMMIRAIAAGKLSELGWKVRADILSRSNVERDLS